MLVVIATSALAFSRPELLLKTRVKGGAVCVLPFFCIVYTMQNSSILEDL